MDCSRPPQNEDGVPHFAYFDESTQTSFVWAGNFDDPIEVCVGGYGEPASDYIDPRKYLMPAPSQITGPGVWLSWFEVICWQYLERNS